MRPISSLAPLILRHTKWSTSHLTPELSLRLITPACELWTKRCSPFRDPYWAFYWPGGQAMARYSLDNGQIVDNRNVIDVGCGCGAGAIAAAKMKARRVLANDIDPYAVAATKINSEANQAAVEISTDNVIGTKLSDFDTVLIGDMFYDEEFANYLFDWLMELAGDGKTILIGDPGRHGLTEKKLQHLTEIARYKLPKDSCIENNGFTETTLWKLNKC